ncbi:MAG: hypothetical protein K9L98_01100 [Candidatus Pacebacteria bacterium]|nr:hypothetical protein [Candidatus Paceibacterota bacterium]MCF7862588.1 hypothetical protein [Candidatus Paceibacterota bacterium]
MKKILIFTIILLLLGVTSYFYFNKGKKFDSLDDPVIVDENKPSQPLRISNGTYCFGYSKDDSEIIDKRNIELIVSDSKITGIKTGYNQTQEYSVGYKGLIEGIISDDGMINAITAITIFDGGGNNQEERYFLKDKTLTELRYSYKEDFSTNTLRIDDSVTDNGQGESFPIEILYTEIPCSG